MFRTQHGSGVEDYGQRERERARAREGESALRRSVRSKNNQHTAAAHRPKCQATAATKSNKAEDPSRLKQAFMTAEFAVFIARRSQSLGDTVSFRIAVMTFTGPVTAKKLAVVAPICVSKMPPGFERDSMCSSVCAPF